jgi:hypothetical protein
MCIGSEDGEGRLDAVRAIGRLALRRAPCTVHQNDDRENERNNEMCAVPWWWIYANMCLLRGFYECHSIAHCPAPICRIESEFSGEQIMFAIRVLLVILPGVEGR